MKKILVLFLAVAMLFTFAACSSPAQEEPAEVDSQAQTQDEQQTEQEPTQSFKIGIIQQLQHNALDAAAQGFQDELTRLAQEEGIEIEFDLQNASGEASNYAPIATKFVNDDVDLILAIATSAAQATATATQEIPILVTAVTDPESAGLVNSNENPGVNVSGTSDMNPIEQQADLLVKLVPEAQTVGLLYCSAEDNSILQAEIAQAEFEALGLEVVVATVADSNEIQAVTTNLINEVDAIYIPTDNTLAGAMATVDMITTPAGIPVICGEENMAIEGGVATYSINYTNLGALTAHQAFDILVNGVDITTMPIQYSAQEDLTVYFNEEKLAEMGLEIPADFQ